MTRSTSGKLRLSLLLTFNFYVLTSFSRDFSGTWQGRLQFWTQDIRLVFKLEKNTAGKYVGTVASPDQDPKPAEIDEVEVMGDSIAIEMSEFEASFNGKFNADSNAIFGKMTQKGFKLPVKLVKGEADDLLYYRPQKPLPPFPYLEEEVRIINKVDGDTLAGTLTKPSGKGKFPALILITGSGPENRDETVFGHKPFLLIADYLTRKGYAVLRCDDRGTGASTGNFKSATTADFARDTEAQLAFLRTRKDIDKKKIGLLGHSEGGIIAPMVAARDQKVGYVILLAAPAIDMFDLLLAQDSLVAKAEGSSRKDINELIQTNTRMFDILKHSKDSMEAQQGIANYLDSINASGTEIEMAIKQLCTPWMRWYVGFEPEKNIEKLHCPVLAMNGGKDVQVPPKVNIPVIDSLLKKNGNPHYETHILPGLNHLFQKCKKCNVAEYKMIDETMAPEALEMIGSWMEQNVPVEKKQ
jgi:uncharacterized protein